MSPGGVDLSFVNKKTGERTGYTPQGMTAEQIFNIPAAKRRWGSIEQVEKYIQRMNAEREIYGGEGLVSSSETWLGRASLSEVSRNYQLDQ